jgi:methyl-accepting chemotaxis protein
VDKREFVYTGCQEVLDKTINKIENVSSNLPGVMAATQAAMENLSAISRDLRQSVKQFPHIASDVNEAAMNIRDASRDLPAIAGSIRKTARGAEDMVEAGKKSWFIRGNLPEPSTEEERIVIERSPRPYEEFRP